MRAADLVDGIWAGTPAFLVGGGPSLKTFDWSHLAHRPNVIVVNGAVKDVPTADIFFTEDYRFLQLATGQPGLPHKPDLIEGWKRFKGLKVVHCLDPNFEPIIKGIAPEALILPRKTRDKRWAKKLEDGLSYSSNSMVGALNLADVLGATTLYLLGVDCNSVGKKTSNYHDLYPDKDDWKTGDHQYESFRSDFTYWCAPNLRHRQVVNLNPTSGVLCWPRRSWDEEFAAVERARHVV